MNFFQKLTWFILGCLTIFVVEIAVLMALAQLAKGLT